MSDNIPSINLKDDDEEEKFIIPPDNFQEKYGDKTLDEVPDLLKGKHTKVDIARALRELYPKYQSVNLTDDFVIEDAANVVPGIYDLIEEAPSAVEQFSYSVENLYETVTHGMPEVVADFVNVLPDMVWTDEAWDEWAEESLKSYKDYQDWQRKNDPRYAAWERWNSTNTGIDEWSDLWDPQLLARSVSNWMSTVTITAVSGAALVAGTASGGPAAGVAAGGVTAYGLGALFEGSDEAISSIDYLTQDKVISSDKFRKEINDFTRTLGDIDESEKRALTDNFIEGNYKLDDQGNIYEKGLSISEAQQLNDTSVMLYTLLGGALEALPVTRYTKRIPGLDKTFKKWVYGGTTKRIATNIRRQPFNPKLRSRILSKEKLYQWGGDAFAESITEFSQYTSQAAIQTGTYKEEDFTEVWSLPEALEASYSGFLGGFGMGFSSNLVYDATGLRSNINNYNKRKSTADRSKVFTRKNDEGNWIMSVNTGGKITDLTDDNFRFGGTVDGIEIQKEYESKAEALQAAETLDNDLHTKADIESLRKTVHYVDATVEYKPTKEGKFEVVVKSKDGNVLNKETFDSKSEARDSKGNIGRAINSINATSKAYPEETSKFQEELGDNANQREEDTDDIDIDIVIGKGFLNDVDSLSPKEQEKELEIEDKREHTYNNPEFFKEILTRKKQEGKLDEYLDQINTTPEDILGEIELNVEDNRSDYDRYNQSEYDSYASIFDDLVTEEVPDTDIPTPEGPTGEQVGMFPDQIEDQDFPQEEPLPKESIDLIPGIIEEYSDKQLSDVIGKYEGKDITKQQEMLLKKAKIEQDKRSPKVGWAEKTRALKILNINDDIKLLNEKAKKLGFDSAEQANLQFNKANRTSEGKKILEEYSDVMTDIKNLSDKAVDDIINTPEKYDKSFLKIAKQEKGLRQRKEQEKKEVKEKRDDFISKHLSEKDKKSLEQLSKKDLKTISEKGQKSSDNTTVAKGLYADKLLLAKKAPKKRVHIPQAVVDNIHFGTEKVVEEILESLDLDVLQELRSRAGFKSKFKALDKAIAKKEKAPALKVGDKAMATDKKGAYVFPESYTIKAIEERDGKQWVLFEETKTGYPIEQVIPAEQLKLQKESTEKVIKERKLKRVVRTLTNKITFPDGSKIKVKLDSTIEAAGQYDPATKIITLNPDKAGMDTPFHEISHPIIDEIFATNPELFESLYTQVVKSKFGKSILKTVKDRGYKRGTDIFKIEVIAESIGRIAAGKYTSPKNPIVQVVERIMNWIRQKFFGAFWTSRIESGQFNEATTIEDLATIISKEGYTINISKPPSNLTAYKESVINQIKMQLAQLKLTTRSRNILYNTIWKMTKNLAQEDAKSKGVENWRRASFDILQFQKVVLEILEIPELSVVDLQDSFNEWFMNRFKGVLEHRLNKKNPWKNPKYYYVEPLDLDGLITHVMVDNSRISEGLQNLSEGNIDINQESITVNTAIHLRHLGVILKPIEYADYASQARRQISFDAWLEYIIEKFPISRKYGKNWTLVKNVDGLSNVQKRILKQDYRKHNSMIRVNRKDGNNSRDHYILRMDMGKGFPKITKFSLKRDIDEETNSTNPQFDKTNLLEVVNGHGIISILNQGDFKTKRVVGKRGDGSSIYGYLPRNSFLNAEELRTLDKHLIKQGLTLIGVRGDSPTLFLAPITGVHKLAAQDASAYWNTQAKYVTKKDRENYLIGTPEELAANIATHETLKEIIPMYHKMKMNNVFKRLKIMTGQITYSTTLPEYKVGKYEKDPENGNLTFVYENEDGTFNTTPHMSNPPGAGRKNIGDGATPVSRTKMNRIIEEFGLDENTSKVKTVVYNRNKWTEKEDASAFAMKHQMFLVDPDVKVYKNYGQKGEKLIWEVDDKGDIIFYGSNGEIKDGQYIDMIGTDDEIKIHFDSRGKEVAHGIETLPGKSMGLIKIDGKSPSFAKHGMQWYNFITDLAIINGFKNNIIPDIYRDLRKMFFLSKGETVDVASKKLENYMNYLKNNDNNLFMPDILGLIELGAFRHQSIAPILNSVLMRRLALPAFTASFQPGTRLDMSPNYRGDLKAGEVALSSTDSKMVWQLYAESTGNTLADINMKKDLPKINKWLKENEVNVFITRSPVPHDGGAMLSRVVRLHNKKGVIEMHRDDTFSRAEGDHDGDHVQVELLPEQMESAIKEYFKDYKITGINLSRYQAKKFEGKFSNKEDRLITLDALSVGKQAVGSIANVASTYGTLNQILKDITIDGVTYTLRKPNSKFRWKVPFQDRYGNWQPYVEITVSDYLRTVLQAAVDNVEFMLLNQWFPEGNIRFEMFGNLFVDNHGRSLGLESAYKLKSLLNKHLIPPNMRNGDGIFDGERESLTLESFIDASKEYTDYIENRESVILGDRISLTAIEQMSMKEHEIEDINFNEGVVSPIEELAMQPYKAYKDHTVAYESKGFRIAENGSPFSLHGVVYANAHLDALNHLKDNRWDALFNKAWNKDSKGLERTKFTPENIVSLKDNEVFVFGSNLAGKHGLGAALTAKNKFGAIQGQGKGLQGQSYGLPTKGFNIENLSLNEISKNVDTFIDFAKKNPDKTFYLTKIATGAGNKTISQMASLIQSKNIPNNVILPIEFSTQELNKKAFIKSEMVKGGEYGKEMTREWFKIINGLKLKTNTTDRNDLFIAYKEKYHEIYQGLSEVAKIAGTFVFLKEYSKGVYAGKAGFPPANLSKNEYQTLHEGVLQEYFKEYNESIERREQTSFVQKQQYHPDETLNEIVNRIC